MKRFSILLAFLILSLGAQAQKFKYGKVSKEEVLETSHPLDKDADAAILFKSRKTTFEFQDGFEFLVITEVHERIKIYSTDGFDWATKEIILYKDGNDSERIEDLEGVTYNIQNGKLVEENLEENGIFEEKLNGYNTKRSFTMPAVAEGSVIEYKYTTKSPFWTVIDKVKLQETIPVNKIDVSVAIPAFLGYKLHFNPKSPIVFDVENSAKKAWARVKHSEVNRSPIVSDRESELHYNENVYSLKKVNVPALKPEVFAGYLPSHAASLEMELQFISFPDTPLKNYALTWEGVAKSIFREGKYAEELMDYSSYLEDIKLLLADKKGHDERARAICQFVKEKAKWNGNFGFTTERGIQKAYKEGEGNVGDINILLTSMMRLAGLNASPVLISTEKNGLPLYPTRSGFNYVICAVQIQGEQYLLDATEKNSDFGELPSRARNWRGRLIFDDERSEWVDLMPKTKSSNKTVLYLTFDENLALSGKTVNVLDGLYAKSYRDRFAGLAEESYLPILEKEKRNIKISDLLVENEEEIGTEIQETFSFQLKDELEKIDGRIYFKPLLFETMDENPFKAEQRTLPIYFDFPKENTALVNIKIPDGFTVESVPESIVLNFGENDGSYMFRISQQGQYLRVESQLEWTNLAYTPEDFPNLKDFYSKIVEKNSEVIVLKKI